MQNGGAHKGQRARKNALRLWAWRNARVSIRVIRWLVSYPRLNKSQMFADDDERQT